MKVAVKHLHLLLDAVVKKCGETNDHAGLLSSAQKIDGIDEKYLYKNIYTKIKGKKVNVLIGLRDLQLNIVARFLGHDSFQQFMEVTERPMEPVLMQLAGNYYSYLRSNLEGGVIFRSPVKMEAANGKMKLELKGPSRNYEGEVRLVHGCLFILMTEPEGKSFHHTYKIGTRIRPNVLQGIFSGVSTAFDPIGGRAVLISNTSSYADLTNAKLSIKNIARSGNALEKRLASYFKEEAGNNLVVHTVKSFEEDDLV